MSKVSTDILPFDGSRLTGAAVLAWDSVRRTLGAGLLAFQRAQMMRALNGLSDHQLAGIGLARSDIPGYVAGLVPGAPDQG